MWPAARSSTTAAGIDEFAVRLTNSDSAGRRRRKNRHRVTADGVGAERLPWAPARQRGNAPGGEFVCTADIGIPCGRRGRRLPLATTDADGVTRRGLAAIYDAGHVAAQGGQPARPPTKGEAGQRGHPIRPADQAVNKERRPSRPTGLSKESVRRGRQ